MNNKYWEEEIETMPVSSCANCNCNEKKTVSIAANSPYYKRYSKSMASLPTASGL